MTLEEVRALVQEMLEHAYTDEWGLIDNSGSMDDEDYSAAVQLMAWAKEEESA